MRSFEDLGIYNIGPNDRFEAVWGLCWYNFWIVFYFPEQTG